jgi:capsular polysaccharide biosynthesis protein
MAGAAEILRELVRRWWLVGVLVVAGALAGFGFAAATTPTYTSKAYVVVVAQNPGDNTSAVSYAQAYARIAEQGDVLDAAVTASKGTTSVAELRRQVRASSSPDAPIIEITGSASSPGKAADLANLVAGGLITTANRHGTDTRITLALLSRAAPPADPSAPHRTADVAVGAAVGLLLGGLAVLAGAGRFRRRPTPAEPGGPEPGGPESGGPEPGAPEPGPAQHRRPAEPTSAAEPIHPTYPAVPMNSAERPVGHVYGSAPTMALPSAGLPSARGELGPDESGDRARVGGVRPPS